LVASHSKRESEKKKYTHTHTHTHTDTHTHACTLQNKNNTKGEKVIDLNKIKQTISMKPSEALKKLTNVQPNIIKWIFVRIYEYLVGVI